MSGDVGAGHGGAGIVRRGRRRTVRRVRKLGALVVVWGAFAWLFAGGAEAAGAGDVRFADLEALAAVVRQHARPLTAEDVFGSSAPVIYVGEDHRDPAVKAWLAAHLRRARAANVTTLGLEAVARRRQSVLDAYLAGTTPRTVVRGLLHREWGYVPDAYTGLITAARDAGMRVLALDRRVRRPDGICRVSAPACQGRDCCMADRIARFAPTAEERLVVLVGRDHARADRQPRQLRDLHALASRSYWFTTAADAVGRVVRRASGFEHAFVPTRGDPVGYDGLVFLR